MKEVRANEDDNTYSQRLETEKNRRSIEYLNETSDHYNDQMAKKRQKNKLMSKAINKEHKLAGSPGRFIRLVNPTFIGKVPFQLAVY